MIVHAAKQRDIFIAQSGVHEQRSQVLLGGDGFGEHHGLAAAGAVSPEVEDHLDGILERAGFGVVRQGTRAGYEALDPGEFGSARRGRRTRASALEASSDVHVLVFQIAQHVEPGVAMERRPACRRRKRAATFSRLAASAEMDEAMRR